MTLQQKPDVAAIARKANVSIPLVLKVVYGQAASIRADELARICAALEAAGSMVIPAHGEAAPMLGVVFPGNFRLGDDFVGQLLEGIMSAVEKYRYSVVFCFQHRMSPDEICDLFQHLSGLITVGSIQTGRLIERCVQQKMPFVLIESDYRQHHDLGLSIIADNRSGTDAAVYHLVRLGHRRIGFITGNASNPSAQERLEAYCAGLQKARLPVETKWIVEGTWLEDSGYEAAKTLLQKDEPLTAIIASNDMMALGVYRAAAEAGLQIGRDLAVVGFDNLPVIQDVSPPLTTVQQPLIQMGQLAVEHLGRILAGETPASREIRVPTNLIVRASTQMSRVS
jgi:DNA-binding LacI/PurR family transcriptional regulator